MDFNEYQIEARKTAFYPKMDNFDLTYIALGLNGEAGEVAEKVKKILRDQNGIINEQNKLDLILECGDCLWYLSNMASELGVDLELVANSNILKLKSRMERNKLTGSGDNR